MEQELPTPGDVITIDTGKHTATLEVTRTLGKRIYYKVLEESSDHYEFHSHITLQDLRNNDKNITIE